VSLAEQLTTCGLAAVGDPPTLTVDVAGYAMRVTASEPQAGHVRLEARAVGAGPVDVARLADAARAAPGDTSFEADGTAVLGRRTLVEPPAHVLHDAVHELAKAVLVLARQGEPTAVPTPEVTTTGTPAVVTPFWFFVDQPTPLHRDDEASEVVAMLMPGTWYEAREVRGERVRAAHPSGVEGWVPTTVVNRS